MGLQHGDGPPQMLNLQTLCQLAELSSQILIYLANATTNDKVLVYSGLFVTICGVNVLGKQHFIPSSANEMAFSVVSKGRARFLWVSLLWRNWEMFCGRYLHSAEFLWHPPSTFDTGLGPRLPEDERPLYTAPYQFVVLTAWRDYFSMAGRLTNPPWTINLRTVWTKRDFCKNRPQRMHQRGEALCLLQLLDLFWVDFFTNGKD